MAAANPTLITNPYSASALTLTTVEGRKAFIKAAGGLKEEAKFDCTSKNFPAFFDKLTNFADDYGCAEATNIVIGQDAAGDDITRPLLTEYGRLTEQQVLDHAAHVWRAGAAGADDRRKQTISYLLYKWVRNSLTDSAQTKLRTQIRRSKVGEFGDGPTLIFLILKKIKPGTKSGIDTIKEEMKKVTLGEHGNNVVDANATMLLKFEDIEQLGGTHDAYMTDLFRMYKTSKNKIFKDYIQTLKDVYEDQDDGDPNALTPDTLIRKSERKYNNMVTNKEWGEVDEKDQKILAMTSIIKQLVDDKKSGSSNSSSSNSTSTKSNNRRGKREKDKGDKKSFDKSDIPTWKYSRQGDETVKNKDGKEYFWCSKHNDDKGMWCRHKEADHGKNGKQGGKGKGKGGIQLNPDLRASLASISEDSSASFLSQFAFEPDFE